MTRFLDGAVDPLAPMYNSAGEQYFDYMKVNGEYGRNYSDREKDWKLHYGRLQEELEEAVTQRIESEAGLTRSEMAMAIIGPGLKPVGKDLSERFIQKTGAKLSTLVSCEFSTEVARAAIEDIRSSCSALAKNTLAMQWDITRLYSTAYTNILDKYLDGDKELELPRISSEADFYALGERWSKVEPKALQAMLEAEKQAIQERYFNSESHGYERPSHLIGGGENKAENLRLTENGKPITIHLWYLPMVLAGTGAAAEQKIWDRYIEAVSENGLQNPELVQKRKMALYGIYNFIANYNTLVAYTAIERIIRDNPSAHIHIATDVSTVITEEHNGFPKGKFPRLHVDALNLHLARLNIVSEEVPNVWKWYDEPEHHHDTMATTYHLAAGAAPLEHPLEAKAKRLDKQMH